MIEFHVEPGAALHGTLRVPGDKSISHRALMLGAIARGSTRISGFLESEDTGATCSAFTGMGIEIERPAAETVIVHGRGPDGLQAPGEPLYLGNSGTSVRLIAGLLAGQSFDSELTGDASLSRRPMARIVEPLSQMGARITCSSTGTLPINIRGGAALIGIDHVLPLASAQLKSALLLAGLYAGGTTCVSEPAITRDHTERLLAHFGCPLARADRRVCLEGRVLSAQPVEIPGDISSAAFFMVAAGIVPGSDILLRDVGVNPTRAAVIDILRAMGADLTLENPRERSGEPRADIRVRHRPLNGIVIPPGLVPIAIDEFPAILVAAAFARGETVLTGAAELRVKESDRISAMADGFAELGVETVTGSDGLVVQGGTPGGGRVSSRGDHRIAMAFAVVGLRATAPVVVEDCTNVNTSFPGFAGALRALGGNIVVSDSG